MPRLIEQESNHGLGIRLGEAVGLADQTRQPRIGRVARKCDDEFERLVNEYQGRVTRLVYRLLGWRGDVEDVVQDVFLLAFKRFDRFRGDSSQWTWLAAIAVNRCRSLWRRRLLEFRWLGRLRAGQSDPADAEAQRDETAERVRKAVAELPARDREVIVLYYLEEWPVENIAKVTGASAGAIDVRLHRARTKLRAILGEMPE
jgi:RNA polymerase sigma-70 factor (ECF subfamily)